MPKQQNQKLRILNLMRFLMENTDDQNGVTSAEIHAYLASQDTPAERKTLYDDLETLRQFGVDILAQRNGNQTLYSVGSRDFQLPELRLLVDSVQSSKFITQKKSLELIGKIENLTSRQNAKLLHRQVYVARRIKTMNESIYYNVDELQSAIAGDKQISFRYYDWSVSRQRIYRRNGDRYTVSPFSLMWDDENYYLLAYDAQAGFIKHYRVDKMTNLRQEALPREGKKIFAAVDLAAYADSHFGMFSGDVEKVRLEFENSLAGPVIDRFGAETILVPSDDGHFTVTVNAAVNEQLFGWLCGFGTRVRILSPASAASAMREHLAAISRLYEP